MDGSSGHQTSFQLRITIWKWSIFPYIHCAALEFFLANAIPLLRDSQLIRHNVLAFTPEKMLPYRKLKNFGNATIVIEQIEL